MKRLCIIKPLLANYLWETILELAQHCQIDLFFSPSPDGAGFGSVLSSPNMRIRYFQVPTLKPLGERVGMIQWGLGTYIRRERPDAIVIFGNPRYASFWTTLLWGRLLGIPVYVHGHGLFKKQRISAFYRLLTNCELKLARSYICYAPIVRDSFIEHGFNGNKLSVAHNSLMNRFPVRPEEKSGAERGILFIGRLRQGSNLQLLIRVIEKLRRVDRLPLTLHVIGTGEEFESLRQQFHGRTWIEWHGEVYDPKRIREISLSCSMGCYPGNAGLSVEHMMSLSLPVITHDDLASHQGPEPSFIRDGRSGLLYDHKNAEESLCCAIRTLASNPLKLSQMRQSAFEDYQRLIDPPLAERIWSILGDGGSVSERSPSVARG